MQCTTVSRIDKLGRRWVGDARGQANFTCVIQLSISFHGHHYRRSSWLFSVQVTEQL